MQYSNVRDAKNWGAPVRDGWIGQMANVLSSAKREPARIEVVLAFLIACVVMVISFVIARHADLNAISDPSVRRLIRHAYAGVGFQFTAVLALAACLLPKHIQEKYLYATEVPNRLVVYFLVLWCLLILLGVRSDVSRALQAAT